MENGNKYRLQKIKEIQKELETEKENRKQLEKIQKRNKSDKCGWLYSLHHDYGVKHGRC